MVAQYAPETTSRVVMASWLAQEVLQTCASGDGSVTAVRFEHLHVIGALNLSQAKLGHAVSFTDCVFDEEVDLTEASLPALTLLRCHYPVLKAQHLDVSGGDLDLRGTTGAVDISGAHVRDDVHLAGSDLSDEKHNLGTVGAGTGGPGGAPCTLRADGAHIGGDLDAGYVSCLGMSLNGAEIQGSLRLRGAELGGHGYEDRQVLCGEQLTVHGAIDALGITCSGAFRLVEVHVDGELSLQNALVLCTVRDQEFPTGVVLDRGHVGGSLFCNDGFVCIGGLKGIGLAVDASAYFGGAVLGRFAPPAGEDHDRQEALNLSRAHIKGNLRLCRNSGGQENTRLPFFCDGIVNLAYLTVECEAHIETCYIAGRKVPLGDGKTVMLAMDMNRFHAASLVLGGGHDWANGPPLRNGIVDLTGASLDVLLDYVIESNDYSPILNGCTYNAIHTTDDDKRIRWVQKGSQITRTLEAGQEVGYRSQTPSRQPYLQLAGTLSRAGEDALSREVLLWMNRAANGRSYPGTPKTATKRNRAAKLWHGIEDKAIGYGYKPLYAAGWLLLLWIVGGLFFWHYRPSPAKSGDMSVVQHITYPLDLLLPIVGLGEQSRWLPNGNLEQAVTGILIAFGWLLAATVVSAITRVLSRS